MARPVLESASEAPGCRVPAGPPELEVRANIAPEDAEAIRALVSTQRGLEQVVAWALAQEPPRLLAKVLPLDEFTNDVVVPFDPARSVYLVYDTS